MIRYILPFFISFLFLSGAQAQSDKFKAAYLYRFASIIDWPETSGDFVIGVFGSSDLQPMLETIASSKKVNERNVLIQKVESIADLNDCDVVYVPKNAKKQLASIYDASKDQKRLIVADGEGLAKEHASISFVESDGKVKFELNKGVMADCGLFTPSILLKLAVKSY